MTYEDLLRDLKAADHEYLADELEAYVAVKVAESVAAFGRTVDYDEGALGYATLFIDAREVESWDDTDQNGTINAYDIVAGHGETVDTLVGKFIFAGHNNPVGDNL